MKQFLILIFISITLLLSCRSVKKTAATEDVTNDVCESMTYTVQQFSDIDSDYYSLDSIFVVNNCLNIWVSYSGGCGDAEFSLYYTNKVMESIPPKSNLLLQLIDNDDCRAIVQQKLFYNLNFFEEYAKKDGITLRFAGIGESVFYKN